MTKNAITKLDEIRSADDADTLTSAEFDELMEYCKKKNHEDVCNLMKDCLEIGIYHQKELQQYKDNILNGI